MADVTEVRLPGVGVRQEYTTAEAERVGVLSHRDGCREIFVYDRDDPDRTFRINGTNTGFLTGRAFLGRWS